MKDVTVVVRRNKGYGFNGSSLGSIRYCEDGCSIFNMPDAKGYYITWMHGDKGNFTAAGSGNVNVQTLL
ncbi:MAG: hypothetical protein V1775_03705 [Bacteroidota bacterium]